MLLIVKEQVDNTFDYLWGLWQGDRGGFQQYFEGAIEGEEVSTEEENARREGQAETHSARSLDEAVETNRRGEKAARSIEVAIFPSASEEAVLSGAQQSTRSSKFGEFVNLSFQFSKKGLKV